MAEHNEAWQVRVFGAEAVGDPGSHAGPIGLVGSDVHHQQSRNVLGDVRVHRSEDAQFVGVLRHMRE